MRTGARNVTTTAEQVEQEQAEYERERAEDEPGEPDDENGEPGEPEPEQPNQVAIGPEEIRKAERKIELHRKNLAAILGDDAVAAPCLLCTGLGFLPEVPTLGMSFTVVETDDGPALDFKAPQAAPEYKEASDKETCDECDGYGMTKTGAKAPAQELWQCGACGGSGWKQAGAIVVTAPVAPPPEPVTFQQPVPEAAPGVLDQWGRASGHPHWGVPPAAIPG